MFNVFPNVRDFDVFFLMFLICLSLFCVFPMLILPLLALNFVSIMQYKALNGLIRAIKGLIGLKGPYNAL